METKLFPLKDFCSTIFLPICYFSHRHTEEIIKITTEQTIDEIRRTINPVIQMPLFIALLSGEVQSQRNTSE